MEHARVARVVTGLAVALALAVLAAHPRVKSLERRLGISVLLSAGLPFLLLGTVFRLDRVGILTPDILADLRPAFEFGLGWIGFVVGMRFDVRRLEEMPPRLGTVVALVSLVPTLTTAALCTLAYRALGIGAQSGWSPDFVRDALVLAACAAPSARLAVEFLAPRLGAAGASLARHITVVDDASALVLLGLVACLFRPAGASAALWVLPSSAWLLVTLGLGGVLGILTYVVVRGASSATEELSLLLGAVALSAGMAGYLALPPPVVCAIAGALLANLPLRDAEGFRKILDDLERPLYLLFLLVVGAAWRPGEWQAWVIAPVFVLARVSGKWLGARLARTLHGDEVPPARALALSLMPQSAVSIVTIVSAATLYSTGGGDRIRWGMNAVILGGFLTEVVTRALQRESRLPEPRPEAADSSTAAASEGA